MLEVPMFLVYAFLSLALTAVMSTTVGGLIVLKGSTFYISAVAHATLAGAALGILLGFPMYYGAFLFGLLGSASLALATRMGRAQEEAAIGVFFSMSMSLAVILIYLIRDYAVKAWSLLLGDPLSVGPADLAHMLLFSSATLLIFSLFRDRLVLSSLDPEGSEALGVRPTLSNFVVYLMASMAVVVALRVIGMILVYAILIVPPAAASLGARSARQFFLRTLAISLGASTVSLPLGYAVNLPISGIIGLILTAVYAVSFLGRGVR